MLVNYLLFSSIIFFNMTSQSEPAFDAFIDDCLLAKNELCNYPKENLDLIVSNIVEGVWEINTEESNNSEIPYLLLLKQLQAKWDEDNEITEAA